MTAEIKASPRTVQASNSSTRTAAAQASVCANVKGKSPASELTERLLAAIAQQRFNLSVLIG